MRKWHWIGHILRKPDTHLSKVALTWKMPGKRKHGRPKFTWRRSVEQELGVLGMGWEEVTQAAQDRSQWKKMVRALHPSRG